jgi:tetratricopeptide (TPR) repeat protein
MLGSLYLQKGDMENARNYYQRALAADPNFAIANANTAWIDAQEGKDLDIALGMAEKAKAAMPNAPSITDTLAWVMYKRGNYAAAIPLLQECVKESPSSADFHYHLGMSLLATGQKAKGKDQLEVALRMSLRKDDAQQAQRELAQLK